MDAFTGLNFSRPTDRDNSQNNNPMQPALYHKAALDRIELLLLPVPFA